MNNSVFPFIKTGLNKLEINTLAGRLYPRIRPFIPPVYAYRGGKLIPFGHQLFTPIHQYTTSNYSKFLKLSNNDVDLMDSTISLDLDVYRNYVDKSGRASFKITESENRLFTLLTQCVEFYKLDMDLRVVGGWVRDKLLEKENKDIDVAIPKMTGLEFCEYLNKFTNEKYGFSRAVGVVKRCPEQSKHLETATMNLLGFDVDFVNLRSEDYSSDSRIPVMRIGTPFEDAMRRDFTVNSLFYNISKNYLEDFTGTGLEDLRNGLIRTCSSAFETFMDDPLRAIRAVRFSSRLNFKLDEGLTESINDEVLVALEQKVSRSRISQEIDNILSKSDVFQALKLMYEFRILHVLLNLPIKGTSHVDPVSGITDRMLQQSCSLAHNLRTNYEDVNYKFLYLSTLVAPTRNLPQIGKMSLADYIIKERLKLPNKYASSAQSISEGSLEFSKFLNNYKLDRVTLGSVIRTTGPLWKESLLLCLAELNRDYDIFDKVVESAKGLGISESYNFKAPITGQELNELLPKIRPGPEFKQALEFQITQRLADEGVSKDELKERLKSHFKQLL